MLLRLWNFLRGYVTVEITGFSAERFLNMAAHRGVYMWDAERTAAGLQMNVSVQGFKRLKGCAKKTKCRVKILRRQGLPFVLHRYRKRKILLGGGLFFVAALYILSSFVWRIDVAGNDRLHTDEILAHMESAGLKVGAFKLTLNDKDLQQSLITRFPDIGWADIYIKGTRAEIRIAETIPKQPLFDRSAPCDIIAAKDGLISDIITGAGQPLVKRNDVVKKGEKLVSGALELIVDDAPVGITYVRSYAEVWAKCYTAFTFSVPYEYTEKVYTGNTKTRYTLHFPVAGGKYINLPGSSIFYDNYDRITHHRQLGLSGNYPLPVILIAEEYAEFIPEPRLRSAEEAEELADRMITGRILREFDFQADIIDKRVSMEELPDSLLVSALITTCERIDQVSPMEIAPVEPVLPPAE